MSADNGMSSEQVQGDKHSYELHSWNKRDKVLLWFSKGVVADPHARMAFSPSLAKHMRAELRR